MVVAERMMIIYNFFGHLFSHDRHSRVGPCRACFHKLFLISWRWQLRFCRFLLLPLPFSLRYKKFCFFCVLASGGTRSLHVLNVPFSPVSRPSLSNFWWFWSGPLEPSLSLTVVLYRVQKLPNFRSTFVQFCLKPTKWWVKQSSGHGTMLITPQIIAIGSRMFGEKIIALLKLNKLWMNG